MPLLALNGVTVKVGLDQATEEDFVIGDQARAFNGDLLWVRRGYKRHWSITTHPMTTTDKTALLSILRTCNVITATGDLPGASTSVQPDQRSIRTRVVSIGNGGERWITSFKLLEI